MRRFHQNQQLGAWGEDQALALLETSGMECVARNVRTGGGEIDLIMRDGGILVFAEVKTRRSTRYGTPEESISKTKIGRIYQAALAYLEQNQILDHIWRIDVVAILCSPDRQIIRIEHYPNIGYP